MENLTMRIFLTLLITFTLSACGTFDQVVKMDSATGYFPTDVKATVVTATDTDLDKMRSLILVSNDNFTGEMVKNIGYFDKVINFEDLEKILIQKDLTDQISSLKNKIGINKAAKSYKYFLWLRWKTRKEEEKEYSQLILTDPVTLEDIFICETYLDYVWSGVTDQDNFYPMMNALVDYIRANSSSYK
jgi:hypothetical protein